MSSARPSARPPVRATPRATRRAALAAAVLLAIGVPDARAAAASVDLTVSAASSLGDALREIAPGFEAGRPGVRVRLNLGASGALLQQLAHGAPVDVFVSADDATMDRAAAAGLVRRDARRDVAANALVVVVPAASGAAAPRTLAALAAPAVARIALGVPESVPAGRYARDALEAAGLWAALAPKVVGAVNVRQALDHVARGEADAGFVYATDAALLRERVRVAFAVPTPRPIRYPAAPTAAAPQPALAAAFVEHLASAPARAILARHGFGRP